MYSDFLGFSESTFFVNIADNSDVNSFFFSFIIFFLCNYVAIISWLVTND